VSRPDRDDRCREWLGARCCPCGLPGFAGHLKEWAASEAAGAKHVNVLQHLMGYLKNHLSLELLGLIEDYRQGPPISSSTSSWSNCRSRCYLWWGGFCQGACHKHAALNRYPVPDWVPVPSAAWVLVTFRLHQQAYPHPYPKELMLRNHV
jgi:hypothetical protein